MTLDGKAITKTELSSFLQAAGFSKSNPYYIVPQGRVTALTNARDEDRLSLLKEIAGTGLYETHRTESIKILQESVSRQGKIEEHLSSINERVNELQEEKKIVQDIEEKDEIRRAREYTLLSREQTEIQMALETLAPDNLNGIKNNSNPTASSQVTQAEIRLREAENNLNRSAQSYALTHALIEAQQAIVRDMTSKEELFSDVTIQDVGENPQIDTIISMNTMIIAPVTHSTSIIKSVPELEEEQKTLVAERTKKEHELEICEQRVLDAKTQEQKLRNQLSYLRSEVEFNTGPIDDKGPFGSDNSLTKRESLKDIEEAIILKQKQITEKQTIYEREMVILTDLNCTMEKLREELTHTDTQLTDSLQEVQEERVRSDRVSSARRALWREQSKCRAVLSPLQEELLNTERMLFESATDRAVAIGLSNLRRICQECALGPSDVLGPLCELFKVQDPIYDVAVETLAGSSLFHIVVGYLGIHF